MCNMQCYNNGNTHYGCTCIWKVCVSLPVTMNCCLIMSWCPIFRWWLYLWLVDLWPPWSWKYRKLIIYSPTCRQIYVCVHVRLTFTGNPILCIENSFPIKYYWLLLAGKEHTVWPCFSAIIFCLYTDGRLFFEDSYDVCIHTCYDL